MADKKAVVVCLNPAIDQTGSLQKLEVGELNRVHSDNTIPGGKGVNVASVLSQIGAEVTLTGFIGADNAEMFEQMFMQHGITDEMLRVEGSNRTNLKLTDADGQLTEINFSGFTLPASTLDKLGQLLSGLARTHKTFIFSGSLPNGVSAIRLAGWIHFLVMQGKTVVFDASGDAFDKGVKALPSMVKPNLYELSGWIGKPLTSEAEVLQHGAEIAALGIKDVVVSCGAQGVLWLRNGEWMRSIPPEVNVVNSVGAGDTLVAGLCWGKINSWSQSKTLKFSTALAAHAVSEAGVEIPEAVLLRKLVTQTTVKPV
ncbi:1-phosphofructokinase [Veronia nyctiphanis]|uniref:Phosphofructokinase n=1 Tax=Veronia nyctiphanis TaxID=1278244 RepID=A0A4Q0YSZ6_9GAMM|nr:1-phosphofructokinase family hexose kinase [Veronia nyctiphanis]RXJ72091.1 1-phosphofructokinase [Veronia nyctiphanis]